jgi:translation initiation factor IF-3
MKKDNPKNQYRVNGQIHVREVRVISDDGSEVMPVRQALDLARQQGVDLVEISPNAQPPVCRLIDYSKFLYQQKKRQKEMKQKQVKVEVKEIRFGPQTDEHDYQFKLKHAQEFLEEGNKVRAYVFFRGRSILFKEQGEVLLLRFANDWRNMARWSSCPSSKARRCFSTSHQEGGRGEAEPAEARPPGRREAAKKLPRPRRLSRPRKPDCWPMQGRRCAEETRGGAGRLNDNTECTARYMRCHLLIITILKTKKCQK